VSAKPYTPEPLLRWALLLHPGTSLHRDLITFLPSGSPHHRLLPTVVEKWVVLRQALLDADGMGGAALWEGDKALRHLSSAVLANIRSPPPALLAALAGDSAAAAAPVASIARIERRRATR